VLAAWSPAFPAGSPAVRDDVWELPVTAKDRRFWVESSVPIVGILWDPVTHEMRWTNLSAHVGTDHTISTWSSKSARR
jgi:hypothetical protein